MDRTSFENHARAWDWIETREFALEPDLVHEARTLMQEDNDPSVSACEGASSHVQDDVRRIVGHCDRHRIIGTDGSNRLFTQ